MTASVPIVCLRLDGAATPAGDRETWALEEADVARLYESARADGLGACLLQTCYRLELVLSQDAAASRAGSHAAEVARLARWGEAQLGAARPSASTDLLRVLAGEDALRHLMRVAAGLESAVLGEPQILGQLRQARAVAEAAGVLTPPLRAVLGAAVEVGQRVRRETDLGRGAASAASAALALAQRAPGGVRRRRVLVIGGGRIGRLLLKLLPDARPEAVTLVSAHASAPDGANLARPSDLPALLPGADVVFVATHGRVLHRDVLRAAWDDARPRTVIDLGMPRNVDPDAARLPHVTLHDIDALGAAVQAGRRLRVAAVPEAEALVEDGLRALAERLDLLRREPLVRAFRRKAERVRRETLTYVCDRCRNRTCEPHDSAGALGPCSNAEHLTRTLTTRLLHDVTEALRSETIDLDETALRRLLALPSLPAPSTDD